MAENNTNAQRYVRIRTNIGWVSVPLLSSGGVDLTVLEEKVKELEEQVTELTKLESKIDEKLDKSAYLPGQSIDEILANTEG